MAALDQAFEKADISYCSNQNKLESDNYPASLNAVLDKPDIEQAIELITDWPGYQPTPLHSLNDLARTIGVAAVYYKDEAHRFGLGSFKALGGAYAVLCLLQEKLSHRLGRVVSFEETTNGDLAELIGDVTVITATDGNHGRSVAWGAQLFGCRSVIYIHQHVSDHRQKAMQQYGAEVVRIKGNYDDSVRLAAKAAQENGWYVISDTSYEGYTVPPRNVMAGYCVMMHEVLNQLAGQPAFTHLFVQAGVGGLAAAMNAYLWLQLGTARPRIIIVEPTLADCLYQSAVSQTPTAIDIEQETLMAGLSCGEVSQLGWQVLELGASDFLTIGEDLVVPAMRLLAASPERIVAGESAVAGLAAVLASSRKRALAEALNLNESSRILLLGTEGATDPLVYKQLTGMDPGELDGVVRN